jgi:hypothetical protein
VGGCPARCSLSHVIRWSEAGLAAFVADQAGAIVAVTDQLLLIFAAGVERPEVPLGSHSFGEEWVSFLERAPGGPTLASQRDVFRAMAPGLAADLGGVEALRAVIDPRLHDLLDGLEPAAASDFWSGRVEVNFGDRTTPIDLFTFRLRDEHGQPAGWVMISKPGISGVVLAMLATRPPASRGLRGTAGRPRRSGHRHASGEHAPGDERVSTRRMAPAPPSRWYGYAGWPVCARESCRVPAALNDPRCRAPRPEDG